MDRKNSGHRHRPRQEEYPISDSVEGTSSSNRPCRILELAVNTESHVVSLSQTGIVELAKDQQFCC